MKQKILYFRKEFESRCGFTLVEIIVVIAVLGIISAVGITLILSASQALSFLTLRSDLEQNADVAMSRMLPEVRHIKDSQGINTATANELRFLDINNVDIDYYLSGNNLMRNTKILASNVNSINFTYYDINGAVLNPPVYGIGTVTDISRIQILLNFENGSAELNYQSQVKPRNFN